MSPTETLITLSPPSFVVDMTNGATLARSLYDGIGRYIFPIRSFNLEPPRIGLPRAVYFKAQTTAVDPANSPMNVLEWLLRNLNLKPDHIYALPGMRTVSIKATDLAVGDIVIGPVMGQPGTFQLKVERVAITNVDGKPWVEFWADNGQHYDAHGSVCVERDA